MVCLDKEPRENVSQRRNRQWDRIILIAGIITQHRAGITIIDIHQEVKGHLEEPICLRTIRRDIALLLENGLLEMEGKRFKWRPMASSQSKAILSAIVWESASGQSRAKIDSDAVQTMLSKVPPPWMLTPEELKATTQACRLMAMVSTRDATYADATLVYRLQGGWTLQRIRQEMSVLTARSIAKIIHQTADDGKQLGEELHATEERWELSESSPSPMDWLNSMLAEIAEESRELEPVA